MVINKKNEMQILVAWEGQILPFTITHKPSKKFLEMGESTDDGLVGEYFYEMFKEAKKGIDACLESGRKDEGKTAEKLVKWGFKIEVVKEEEGNFLYKLVDNPIKDDSGKPAY